MGGRSAQVLQSDPLILYVDNKCSIRSLQRTETISNGLSVISSNKHSQHPLTSQITEEGRRAKWDDENIIKSGCEPRALLIFCFITRLISDYRGF